MKESIKRLIEDERPTKGVIAGSIFVGLLLVAFEFWVVTSYGM